MKPFLSEYKQFPVGWPISGSIVDPHSLGYVYIIGFDEPGIVKIGSTNAIGIRLSELQTGNPFELRVHAAVSIYSGTPIAVEMAAHKRAHEVGEHIRGEWFAIDADDALRCVINAAKSKRVQYGPYARAFAEQEKLQAATVEGNAAEKQSRLRTKLGLA